MGDQGRHVVDVESEQDAQTLLAEEPSQNHHSPAAPESQSSEILSSETPAHEDDSPARRTAVHGILVDVRSSTPTRNSGCCWWPSWCGNRTPATTRTTSLNNKVIRGNQGGNPYSDLQLLWFRKRQKWPSAGAIPWPTDDQELLDLVKLADEFWSTEQKDRVKRLDGLNADASSGRNEQYQLVGLYAVFLGVFFSSAAQTNNLKCQDWPILIILTVVVTVFTLIGFFQKSSETHKLRDRIENLLEKYKHIESQIKELRQHGPKYPFGTNDLGDKPSSFDIEKTLGLLAILAFTTTICVGIYFVLCRSDETCLSNKFSILSSLRL